MCGGNGEGEGRKCVLEIFVVKGKEIFRRGVEGRGGGRVRRVGWGEVMIEKFFLSL